MNKRRWTLGKHGVLLLMSFAMLFPVVLTISSALKSRTDVRTNPFGVFSSFSLESLERAWNVGHFGEYLVNTFVLAFPSTVLVVALSTMAGYAFARLNFPGRDALFVIVLATLGLVLEDTLTRLNALKQAVAFCVNIAAAVFFLFSGQVLWSAALVMAVGGLGLIVEGVRKRAVGPSMSVPEWVRSPRHVAGLLAASHVRAAFGGHLVCFGVCP